MPPLAIRATVGIKHVFLSLPAWSVKRVSKGLTTSLDAQIAKSQSAQRNRDRTASESLDNDLGIEDVVSRSVKEEFFETSSLTLH